MLLDSSSSDSSPIPRFFIGLSVLIASLGSQCTLRAKSNNFEFSVLQLSRLPWKYKKYKNKNTTYFNAMYTSFTYVHMFNQFHDLINHNKRAMEATGRRNHAT